MVTMEVPATLVFRVEKDATVSSLQDYIVSHNCKITFL
jgi:hypothetical protein